MIMQTNNFNVIKKQHIQNITYQQFHICYHCVMIIHNKWIFVTSTVLAPFVYVLSSDFYFVAALNSSIFLLAFDLCAKILAIYLNFDEKHHVTPSTICCAL